MPDFSSSQSYMLHWIVRGFFLTAIFKFSFLLQKHKYQWEIICFLKRWLKEKGDLWLEIIIISVVAVLQLYNWQLLIHDAKYF